MNATDGPTNEAMVVELRMSAGTYTAMIKALRRSGKLSGAALAAKVQECAKPVPIAEDATRGTPTCLPVID